MINIFRRLLPKISETEKAALLAGTISIDKNIMYGNLSLKYLKEKYSYPKLSNQEKSFLEDDLHYILKDVNDWEINNSRNIPNSVLEKTKQKNLFGMIIPKKFNGLDFNPHARCKIVEKIGSKSIALLNTVMVPNSLGPGELLIRYGTDNQKNYFLPKLANGELIPCFGLTGIKSGSDAANMEDYGVIVKKNNKLFIEMNCNKRYITLAPISNLVGVAFKLKDSNKLLGDTEDLGITVALVETEKTGELNDNKRHYPIGSSFYNGPIRAKNYLVPIENIIGENNGIGKGWNMLMECLSEGRAISLPSIATLSCYKSAFIVGAYTQARKQFKIPLYKMEGIQNLMNNVARNSFITKSAQALTNSIVENHERPTVISAIMKERTTELARKSLNDTMDICAGWAVIEGPNNVIASDWNSMPVAITVEGSNTLTRNLIIFGQGLLRSHYNLLDTINSIENNNLNKVLLNGTSIVFKTLAKDLYLLFEKINIFNDKNPKSLFLNQTDSLIKYYEKKLKIHSTSFFVLSNLSLFYGSKIKAEQLISGRCAQIFGNLYLAYSCLWNYEKLKTSEKYYYKSQFISSMNYLLNENSDNFNALKENSLYYKLLVVPNRENNKNIDYITKDCALSLINKNVIKDNCENLFFNENKDDMLSKLKKYSFCKDKDEKNKLENEIIQVSEFNIK